MNDKNDLFDKQLESTKSRVVSTDEFATDTPEAPPAPTCRSPCPLSSEKTMGQILVKLKPLCQRLDRLDETDRQLIQYAYYQEMSAAEIGSIMQLAEKTIRRRQQRVKKTLKDTMRQIGDEIDLAPDVL